LIITTDYRTTCHHRAAKAISRGLSLGSEKLPPTSKAREELDEEEMGEERIL
jgi:hypothetical protein